MITTTHAAVGGVVARWGRIGRGPVSRRLAAAAPGRAGRTALVIGCVLADLPLLGSLVVATAGAVLGPEAVAAAITRVLRDDFPAASGLVAAHVGLHAPIVGIGLLLLGRMAGATRAGPATTGLGTGLLLHTFLDALTHADDGPLLLWPLGDGQFDSPLAWHVTDPLGPWLLAADVLLGLLLGAWLVATGRRRPA